MHNLLHLYAQITTELYHEDKEFENRRTVFLSSNTPSTGMKHVLLATPQFDRLVYSQGSPLDTEVSVNCADSS